MENLTEQFGKLDLIARSAREYLFPGGYKYTGPIGPAGIVVMTSDFGPIPKRKDGGRSQNFLVLSENVPYEFVGTPDGSEPYPTGIVLVMLTDDYEFLDWTPQTKTLGSLQAIHWCSDGSMEAACAESTGRFHWNIIFKPGREEPRRERRQPTGGIFDADEYRNGGWRTAIEKQYTYYQRLGLSAHEHISSGEVSEAHKARANWWRQRGAQAQSGKNNPLIAELAPFISIAEENLRQALAVLTDVDRKSAYDRQLEHEGTKAKEDKLQEFIRFTLRDKILTPTEKNDLLNQAQELGILRERAEELIRAEIRRTGATEGDDPSASVLTQRVAATPAAAVGSDSPRLVLSQTSLSLGTLRRGDRRDCKVSIDNRGGGVLAGSIHSSHPAWLSASQTEIDPRRHHQEISLGINTSSLDLGKSYVGAVEIRSNGGRESIRVEFSVELEKTALLRYSHSIFWLGFCLGGVLGYLVYASLPDNPSRTLVSGIAGLVGLLGAIVVSSRNGGFAGGCGALVVGSIVLGVFQRTLPPVYSILAWATTVGSLLHTCARPLFVGKLAGNSGALVRVIAGTVTLSAAIIIGGLSLRDQVSWPSNNSVPPLQMGTVATCKKATAWRRFVPKSEFRLADPICVYAEALNVNHEGRIDLTFNLVLKGSNNVPLVSQTNRFTYQGKDPASWRSWQPLKLPANSSPGVYAAEVSVHDNLSNTTGTSSAQFTVVGKAAAAVPEAPTGSSQGSNPEVDTVSPSPSGSSTPPIAGAEPDSGAKSRIDHEPSDPEASKRANAEGVALLRLEHPDPVRARSSFETAVRLDSSNIEALNNLGYSYQLSGNFSEAEKILLSVIRIAPDRRAAYGNLSFVEAKLGRHRESVQYSCAYISLFGTQERGKNALKRLMSDSDVNVREALKDALSSNCH